VNGCNTFQIVFWHILPYLWSYVFMVFIIQTGSAIISESCISMIGLGPYDTVSLGTILNDSVRYGSLRDGAWWAFMPATFLISIIVFAFFSSILPWKVCLIRACANRFLYEHF